MNQTQPSTIQSHAQTRLITVLALGALLLAGAILILVLPGCAGGGQAGSPLYGGWEQLDPDSGQSVVFIFRTNNTFTLTISAMKAEGTFEFVDADTIRTSETDVLPSMDIDFRVEGNTLYLTANGETETMTRLPDK